MNDSELLERAVMYGRNALEWRRKFIGLLPEINKRKLYESKNCSSIFEFAFKFGGLSEEQVSRALNLEKKFEDLPKLRELLVNGEVSVNKLLRIASIATVANQEKLVEAVKILPKKAIETFVRDTKSVPGHKLELNDEVSQRLSELQEKGIDVLVRNVPYPLAKNHLNIFTTLKHLLYPNPMTPITLLHSAKNTTRLPMPLI